MPPPELPRDVPVRRVLERVDREAVLRVRVIPDATLVQRFERRLLELLHPAPPLERDQRLDPALAPLAERDRVAVRLALDQQPALAEPLEDALFRLVLGEAGELAGGLVHAPVEPYDRQLG